MVWGVFFRILSTWCFVCFLCQYIYLALALGPSVILFKARSIPLV